MTLIEVSPCGFEMFDIIMVTLPAAVIGVVLSSVVVNRLGANIEDDPEIQERIRNGGLEAPGANAFKELDVKATTAGRNAALIFLTGVLAIVVFVLLVDSKSRTAAEEPWRYLGYSRG